MNKKEFNLSEKRIKGFQDGDFYPAEDVKEFVKRLTQASEENDWEVAIDDGEEDGFRIISGVEFIDALAGEKLK